MAIAQNMMNNRLYVIHTQHTVGRDPNNTSVINYNDASRKHAVIYWESNRWKLTDFSSNGTKVNSKLIHHETVTLKMNDLIQFSSSQKDNWKIINIDEPRSFLDPIEENNEIILLNKEGIIMESQTINSYVFQTNKNKWILDNETREIELINGKIYLINNIQYRFIDNESLSKTLLNADITKNACFKLFISIDEEHIISKIEINDLELDLGNRVFNHLLLYLVRKKQKDLNYGVNVDLCGWVNMDDLYISLGKELLKDVDAYYVNTLIYRLRKNLMKLQPYGFLFANIIERKKGKLRFGLPKFEINKEHAFA
ncbi:FHA domain-containing protein [Tenacibaculum sp. MAR_2009_124]|uniref:FHA domain-containing protein n=1 Tax=Tenacibaculum sp. MAR_2009_124 TaxID=1250059 RepID=UPI000896A0A1|nr:FHA domain-containing protein [Tenacibaculum sp. MAR_2009_124]SEB47484.1 FHA domain-containing protein [Tenacibaculum sp. MAR_2009_124]